jgi:NAD(P)H dehydrogenase (quinone)
VVTVGGGAEGYGPRGLDGNLTEVLFPLLHGTFFYTGMAPLPPVAVHSANHVSTEDYAEVSAELRARLAGAETDRPLPYRTQHGGDYDEDTVLHADVATDRPGLDVHLMSPVRTSVAG